jgi:hypothetical protein
VPVWVWAVVLVLALASRPIEVRLWRAGRLSDRAVTILALSRMPLLSLFAAIALGASLPVAALVMAASLVGPILFYRFTLDLVREQHRSN